jgi:dihydroxyacetone kinase-like predicted kinase
MQAFREVWAGIGDSIVIVGGDGLYNCHIHTDEIGAAIEAALDAGTPRDIRITDLSEQIVEERWVREGSAVQPEDVATAPAPTTSVVAVVVGDGVGRIFPFARCAHAGQGRPVDEPVDVRARRGGARDGFARW